MDPCRELLKNSEPEVQAMVYHVQMMLKQDRCLYPRVSIGLKMRVHEITQTVKPVLAQCELAPRDDRKGLSV